MSSLDPDVVSASEFQGYILGHWEVENCLHLQKERYLGEDKHAVWRDWGEAWTVLTTVLLNLGRLSLGQLLWQGERTLKEVRERCYIDPVPTAKKLGWKKLVNGLTLPAGYCVLVIFTLELQVLFHGVPSLLGDVPVFPPLFFVFPGLSLYGGNALLCRPEMFRPRG